MAHVVDVQEEEEKETNVVALELIRGGKDDGTVEDQDWLSSLEEGSIFLTQAKPPARDFHLDQFQLVQKTDKSYFLVSTLNGMVKLFVPKPAHRFCGKYGLWEVLSVAKEMPEEEINE